jgi:DNA repair ATPase RecN
LQGPLEAWEGVSVEEKKKYEKKYEDYHEKYKKIKEAIAIIREWNRKLQEFKQSRHKHYQLTSDEKIVEAFLTQSSPMIDSKRPTFKTIKKVSETVEVHKEA